MDLQPPRKHRRETPRLVLQVEAASRKEAAFRSEMCSRASLEPPLWHVTPFESKAKTATEDAAAKAVRNFASDDDLVPVEMKAKAAGMAATTLGAALARKLVRSAGSIIASMLIAYLTKKVVDLVLRR